MILSETWFPRHCVSNFDIYPPNMCTFNVSFSTKAESCISNQTMCVQLWPKKIIWKMIIVITLTWDYNQGRNKAKRKYMNNVIVATLTLGLQPTLKQNKTKIGWKQVKERKKHKHIKKTKKKHIKTLKINSHFEIWKSLSVPKIYYKNEGGKLYPNWNKFCMIKKFLKM